jgi:Bacterial aa3 type cytochrome c oxidase subunit IV
MNIDLTEANENMDMAAHVRTFHNFGNFIKYTIAVLAVLLAGMAIFLT